MKKVSSVFNDMIYTVTMEYVDEDVHNILSY